MVEISVRACLTRVGGDGGGLVGRGRGIGLGLGVDSSSLVGHISNVSIITVGGVGDTLDSTIGKSNRVGALGVAGAIGGLVGAEAGLGVVIGHGVGVGVGQDLVGVDLGLVGGGRGVGHRGRGVLGGSQGGDDAGGQTSNDLDETEF